MQRTDELSRGQILRTIRTNEDGCTRCTNYLGRRYLRHNAGDGRGESMRRDAVYIRAAVITWSLDPRAWENFHVRYSSLC